jgi:hypothetical protein
MDLVLGRQAITWGTGRFWQPTDLMSPFGALQVDREFKPGSDAARLLFALGDFTHAELVWAFGEDADPDDSAGLCRFRSLFKNYDLMILGGWVQKDLVAGWDLAGDLGDTGIGLHGEGLFNRVDGGTDYVQLLLGLDYRFPGRGPYLLGEYYFNGAGATSGEGLERAIRDERILSRGNFQLGRHLLGLGATYEIFPILQGMFNILANLSDPSALLNPVLEYSVSDNATATLGLTVPMGEAPTFFVFPGTLGLSDVRLESEFGTYPVAVFVEFRYYMQ